MPDINKLLKAAPVSGKYGAPMGSSNYFVDRDEPLNVQLVKMVDGDYSADGTYWGGPPSKPLYCAFSSSNRIYVRATSRSEAIELVEALYPSAKFYTKECKT